MPPRTKITLMDHAPAGYSPLAIVPRSPRSRHSGGVKVNDKGDYPLVHLRLHDGAIVCVVEVPLMDLEVAGDTLRLNGEEVLATPDGADYQISTMTYWLHLMPTYLEVERAEAAK